jgi:hypothetical protein
MSERRPGTRRVTISTSVHAAPPADVAASPEGMDVSQLTEVEQRVLRAMQSPSTPPSSFVQHQTVGKGLGPFKTGEPAQKPPTLERSGPQPPDVPSIEELVPGKFTGGKYTRSPVEEPLDVGVEVPGRIKWPPSQRSPAKSADEVVLRFDRGRADVDDVRRHLTAIVTELHSGGGESTRRAEAAGLDRQAVRDVAVEVQESTAGIDAPRPAIQIGIAGGLTASVANKLWQSVFLPLLTARLGPAAIGRKR